jgi:hypothetical protein
MDLYVGQHQDINKIGLERGVYVSVNRKNTNPYNDFRNMIDVSTGVETNILVERSEFHKAPKPYSNCDIAADNDDPRKDLNMDPTSYQHYLQSWVCNLLFKKKY